MVDLPAGIAHDEQEEVVHRKTGLRQQCQLEDGQILAIALPLPQREAFLLQAEGGLSLTEIAQATGVNAETAKSRLRYARERLRQTLETLA